MCNDVILPVILAGGGGSRLWPLSRNFHPKQFLNLTDSDLSMLQITIKRFENIGMRVLPPIIICNEEHRFLVAEQLRQLDINNASIILEPMGKNTTPAITLAMLQAQELYKDISPVVCVVSSDHYIADVYAFAKSIELALIYAKKNLFMVLGVKPSSPHTGYGYIKTGKEINNNCYVVSSFFEKPELNSAIEYVNCSDFLWNVGIFVFEIPLFFSELNRYRPDIFEACSKVFLKRKSSFGFIWIDKELFDSCPASSIDCTIMEKTNMAGVVCLESDWKDLGSWQSLWEHASKDSYNNACSGDVVLANCNNNYIHANSRLITALGINDLIIVETKDSVLVADKNKSEEIKIITDYLSKKDRKELFLHNEVMRPWGKYRCLDSGEGYQVKYITVNPKSKLSLQKHQYRSEHWTIIKGRAKVTKEDGQFFISENQNITIPIGVIHSLENPDPIPLILVEVQIGDYLGEDDIVRFQDDYGRV
ncbi:mannose-1-phosphate guanylyltransferase/mannose-6-phosphate isomerase [Acinetobacter sp. AOR15_HL]|uniref:mannose-1-phosphate guanylyltransferase/mannose-6-phosphate isomerase n=1 Tax=unclassified Acinetobacter TaxID=196816 RepID=UPI0022EA9F3D|nr:MULTISPECIES: mannose-1-phosphate guanylyltransferase/mannose-6-phosphate isomerase [unclassified Acinetobacter]MDA3556156.1 mannose-1-phosphate guanylyltransferase/mannose-6-phosphate isomerase [Acinetobacter sp. AOR15_HL]MDA3571613.1 mannose-1-phosphate guanylyltransferase/mannose-6-phosphate isomerase [Acinetobacter sp. AOR14_HL]